MNISEADGSVKRTVFSEIPHIEYEIPEGGSSLPVHINGLVKWGTDNMEVIKESRLQFKKQ